VRSVGEKFDGFREYAGIAGILLTSRIMHREDIAARRIEIHPAAVRRAYKMRCKGCGGLVADVQFGKHARLCPGSLPKGLDT